MMKYGNNHPKPAKYQTQRLLFPTIPAVVVSIHDVCPKTRETTVRMLADIRDAGAGVTSLLVIPDRHKSDPAFADKDFCGWVKREVSQGHEVVLHGYYHQRMAEHEQRGVEKMIATRYTAGEGEFFDLSEEKACELLGRGVEEMTGALGEVPRGFIAPAWLMGEGAREGVKKFSFDYTTTVSGVWDLKEGGGFYPSQSLCYSVRAGWRRACSLGWNSLLLAWLEEAPLVRIGLHPPDWDYPHIRAHALRCIERALAGRRAMTYISWIDQQRIHSQFP